MFYTDEPPEGLPPELKKNWRAGPAVPPLRDRNPRRTLLRALQARKIRARKNGKVLDPDVWMSATERDLDDERLRFRRKDVLKLWPEKGRRPPGRRQQQTRQAAHEASTPASTPATLGSTARVAAEAKAAAEEQKRSDFVKYVNAFYKKYGRKPPRDRRLNVALDQETVSEWATQNDVRNRTAGRWLGQIDIANSPEHPETVIQ